GSVRTAGLLVGVWALGLAWCLGRRFSRAWCYRLWVIALVGLIIAVIWLPGSLRPMLWGSFTALGACLAWWLFRGHWPQMRLRAPKPSAVAKSAVAGSVIGLAILPAPWLPVLWSQ